MNVISRPVVGKIVLDRIQNAERMHDFILRAVPEKFLSDTDEKILVVAFFSLAVQHHAAILHLLRDGRFDGSALALVRPLIEATYRAHWVYACSSPEQVAQIKKGRDVYPRFPDMASEVEAKIDAGGIFAEIKPYINSLHGYTHGGLEQLGRQFNAAGDVQPNYSDGVKSETINATTAYLTALAIAWCQLTATEVPDKEPRSKAISDKYIELYGAPSST